jgi:hypothetical protein
VVQNECLVVDGDALHDVPIDGSPDILVVHGSEYSSK